MNSYWLPDNCNPHVTISNKVILKPLPWKTEPFWQGIGSDTGYSFKHFWGNVHALLGKLGSLDGIQQLVHHYYLQNGRIMALETAIRIKKLLGNEPGDGK